MKLNTLLVSVAVIAGLASAADANAPISLGDLHGSSMFHHILVGDHKLDAGISLPAGVVGSDAGFATASLCFTTSGGDGPDNVTSYDVKTGRWSSDNKRQARASHESSACYKELQG